MKQYIKSLALLLMVSLGFVACNDNDDFDDFKVNYPSSVPLGYYHSDYTANGDYEYAVLLTKNADNDTIMQLFLEGKAGSEKEGTFRTIMTTSNVAYDDTLGMLVAVSGNDSYYETPVQAVMAYKQNKRQLILEMSYGNKKVNTILSPAVMKSLPVTGNWASDFMLVSLTEEKAENGEFKGSVTVGTEQGPVEIPVTYTFDGTNGTFTQVLPEGTTGTPLQGTFSYDANYALVVNFAGQTFTVERSYSTPEPEIFSLVGTGVYSHSVGVIEGGPVYEGSYPTSLYVSAENPNRYKISPWLDNPDGLLMTMDPNTGELVIPQQPTGEVHPSYGPIYAIDCKSYTGGELGNKSYFDGNNTFFLELAYVVSAGYFGIVNETFVLDAEGEAAAAKAVKKQNQLVRNFKAAYTTLYEKNF